jgi:hypothetical protein
MSLSYIAILWILLIGYFDLRYSHPACWLWCHKQTSVLHSLQMSGSKVTMPNMGKKKKRNGKHVGG